MVTVLVVEDEATSSADEAAAVLDGTFEPDVVLTDMFMPGGSGPGLVNALREHPRCADLRVIFLSGRALPGARPGSTERIYRGA